MPNNSPDPQWRRRDGTSQASRWQAALDPEHVCVDERSYKDLLAFAQAYAKELRYYDADNQPRGDWSAFLGAAPALSLDEIVAFMHDPTQVRPETAARCARPHVVLFLTFLHLLRYAQDHLNTLTRRHLDFYYRQVLRMTRKPGIPDQVNVLIDVTEDVEHVPLAAGTLLHAGTDSLGQDLRYRTERAIVANRAQVARLSSVHVARRITGIRAARDTHQGPPAEAFMCMLQVALGDPLPGDPLPLYDKEKIDYASLVVLHELVNFVRTGLHMTFADFRSLMQLKHQREQADAAWAEINQLLEKAARKRTNNAALRLPLADPRAFEANLRAALGDLPNFDGLPQVENINDLYEQRIRQDVQRFIREHLYLDDITDFTRLMQLKVLIDYEWQEINRILEQAGQRQRNDPSYRLAPADPSAFDSNLNAALGPIGYASLPRGATLDDYYTAWLRVEQLFWMSAEDFADMMEVARMEVDRTPTAPPPQAWDRVYALLAEAYKAKFYAARLARLQAMREAQGFGAMLRLALGEDAERDAQLTELEKLQNYVSNKDAAFLEHISQTAATGSVPSEDWDRVYRIVEIAQRVRERSGEPVAQQEVWLNLYPAADATAVVATLSTEAEPDQRRWKTFGQGQTSVRTASPPPTVLGWAISSPLLALSEGRRRIALTMGFQPEQFHLTQADLDTEPFHLQISTATGWIEPGTLALTCGDYQALSGMAGPAGKTLQALQCVLTFDETVEALAAPPPEDGQIDNPWPILRLRLRQIWQPDNAEGTTGMYITHYQPYKDLVLVSTHLQVKVDGLTTLQMQNDETVLPVNKPFEPFGTSPAVGSRFSFGHPEVVRNTFDSLTFTIDWMGVPQDIAAHYQNYPQVPQEGNGVFKARVSLVDKRRDVPLNAAAPLFNEKDATATHTLTLDVPVARYARYPEMVLGDDLRTWDRYLQWELQSPDFQHGVYPIVAAQKALALAADIVNKQTGTSSEKPAGPPPEHNQAGTSIAATTYQVNPPYTPKIKRLSLDYTASVEIGLEAYRHGAQPERLWHIHPFGYHEVQPDTRTRQYLFLPQYDNEGELYIGLQGVRPPQNLALLFQMAAGSADPDLTPVPVQWHYLSGNRWLPLDEGNILQDTTRGLINTGIIDFALAPVQPSTLLPAHLYWLRAAIWRHSPSVCDTIAIHTQAVSATFIDQANAPEHLSRPLPAGSITNLVEPLPAITGIRQPYTSYGGKMGEQDSHLYTRVSERLRHKHRALTIWDYEHMVLERFPEVYKVKCLPADPTVHPDDPGRVEIVVIPDIRNKLPFNPFEPKASADLLADIAAYLADYCPAWATVHVKNAQYVPVKVRFAVRFHPGYNEGFYQQYLNDELNRFLSPWAYDEGAEIEIGGRIYANVIINFLEERPYVDYVANIKLFSSEDHGRTFRLAGDDWVQTDRPDGILVAAQQHEIDLIREARYEAHVFTGINYMKLELDFIVG